MKDAGYSFDDEHYHKLKRKLLEALKQDEEQDEDDLEDIDDETLYEILTNKEYLLRIRKKLKMMKRKKGGGRRKKSPSPKRPKDRRL